MPVSLQALKRGLLALGDAYGRKVDAVTEALWLKLMAELNDDQFNHAVGVQLRSADRFFPPPGVVLAYGFDAPRPVNWSDSRPMPRVALPEWHESMEIEGRLLSAFRENPISERERDGGMDGRLHYIRRLAIAAELMDESGNAVKVMA